MTMTRYLYVKYNKLHIYQFTNKIFPLHIDF